MILQQPSAAQVVSRRSAFTLLEVLVVVAIILVLASGATVAVMQILKENKDQSAKINAMALSTALKTYMTKNNLNPPNSIEDILLYVDGNDPQKLVDPWGNHYQIGTNNNAAGQTNYYIYTVNPESGVEIRSDTKN